MKQNKKPGFSALSRYLSILFLIVAITSTIIGISNKEPMLVFFKAINICLECIGIG